MPKVPLTARPSRRGFSPCLRVIHEDQCVFEFPGQRQQLGFARVQDDGRRIGEESLLGGFEDRKATNLYEEANRKSIRHASGGPLYDDLAVHGPGNVDDLVQVD